MNGPQRVARRCYDSARATYAERDLFLMFSDGMPEVFNENYEEFGLTGLQQVLAKPPGLCQNSAA